MAILDVNHLKKYYGTFRGVDDVNFQIEEGEIFGFIGPNGAGKSTTIRCALSLIYPTEGAITIFGLDSIKDRVEIAKNVGYLPSEVNYYDNMTVAELLDYSASFYPKVNPGYRQRMVNLLELDEKKKIEDLSLGNRKKVGIVQALQHEPKLLILDEPTSGLDPLMQHHFFDLLQEQKNKGNTVLFSSHNLEEVKRLCDRIAIIRQGKVEEVDELKNLSANLYKNVTVMASEEALKKLDSFGALTIQQKNEGSRLYQYRGDLNRLIQELSQCPLTHLSINDPSLEELFMDYYK